MDYSLISPKLTVVPASDAIRRASQWADIVRIDVLPNGQVLFVTGVSAHGWISLSGILYETP